MLSKIDSVAEFSVSDLNTDHLNEDTLSDGKKTQTFN